MIVVPVYNMILVPFATMYFQTEQLKKSAGEKEIAINDKIVLIVAKEATSTADMKADSFYPIGVVGTLAELNRQGYAVVRTQYRVNLEDVSVNPDHTIQLSISRRNDTDDMDIDTEREKLNGLLQEMRRFSSGSGKGTRMP